MGKKVGIIPWPLSKRRGGGGGLLSACRYPRTTSFADGRGGDREFQRAATLEDIDRFLCENFSSLYDGSVEKEHTRELVDDDCPYGSAGGSAKVVPAGDHARGSRASEIVLASTSSRRFFLSTPGKSSAVDVNAATTLTGPPSADDYSSITTSRSTTTASSAASASSSSPDCQRDSTADSIPDDGVAVVTFSKDPEDDFFRSMEEMLDAHLSQQYQEQEQQQLKPRYPALVDWDFMQDLLLCYLHLNDPRVHSHILQAFADLVAELKTRKDVVLSEEAPRGGGGEATIHEKGSDLSELEDNTSCCDCCCHDRSDSDEGKGISTA